MNEIKERILSESSLLFMKKGCKSITMDYVANQLGVSKRTLYEIFKDKEDLLEQSITYKSEQLEKKYSQFISENGINPLESFLTMVFSTTEVVIKMQKDFVEEIKKYYPKVYTDTILRMKQINIEFIEKMLQKGKREKLVKEDINTHLTSYVLNDMNRLFFHEESYPYNMYGKKELLDIVLIVFLRGIATRKGLNFIDNLIKNPSVEPGYVCFNE